ncbi:putative F-box-like domain protein [Rhizoctonia solani 123E]|uniref:Putative F-box-like domain protein n=1 Tax=Rhizoctonia solani 123E TaxID=1423351 RepID=A0A074RYP7_9AGAM|nr:putative F-box-like domain protein [Rhizoctonia solani 123E]
MEDSTCANEQIRIASIDHLDASPVIQPEGDMILRKPPYHSLELALQQDTTLTSNPAYESKAKRARLATDNVSCCSPDPTPIHTLPPEMLSLIFYFTLPPSCNPKDHLTVLSARTSSYPPIYMSFPEYPADTLAHVCSSWRSIAISSHSLWTHIDLSCDDEHYKQLLDRGETYVARTGKLPLELHILDAYRSRGPTRDALQPFLSRIAGRVGSLELCADPELPLDGQPRHILQGLFYGQPKALTKFVMRYGLQMLTSDITYCGPKSCDASKRARDSLLNFPSRQIEDLLAPVKILHLYGVAPRWSSKAYCGLSDLRLSLSAYGMFIIDQSRFITILKSSPALQILHFDLDISLSSPMQDNVTPVDLPDLQVLKLSRSLLGGSGKRTWVEDFLPLLVPGAKPFHLWIDSQADQHISAMQELEKFFARSKIVRFYYADRSGPPPINTILRHGSYLKVLLLHRQGYECGGYPIPSNHLVKQVPQMHLTSLHLIGYRIYVDFLRDMLDLCPGGVVLYNVPDVASGSVESPQPLSKQQLLDRFPAIRITHTATCDFPYPADWDIVD